MKLIAKITILILISIEALNAKDAKNGEDIYYFSDCANCHSSSDFSIKNRNAKNYIELKKSVNACRYSTNVDWFDDEYNDVVHYLNTKYYKYEIN